ncbi:hypothetical protein Tco_0718440 [Tanacetum coccineum]
MPGEGVNIDDFLSGNFRNDSQSSYDTFAAHNEKVTTLEDNINSKDALLRNDTWKITELPKDRKAIGLCSWGKGTDYYTWCKKTVECVACLLGRWNRSRGTDWMTSMQAALIWFVWRVKENGRSGWLCFLDRWKSALGTSLVEDVRGSDVYCITVEGISRIGIDRGGNNTREPYGGWSSYRVA